jgi:hypothetical protein
MNFLKNSYLSRIALNENDFYVIGFLLQKSISL